MLLTALCGVALVVQVGGRIREGVPRPISTPESCACILQCVLTSTSLRQGCFTDSRHALYKLGAYRQQHLS